MAKKVKRKIIAYSLVSIMMLMILFAVLIRMPAFQTYLTKQATKILSEQLGTRVSIKSVNFTLYTHLQLDELYIADDHADTLLFVQRADVSLGMLSFFNKKIDVTTLELYNTKLYVSKDKSALINFATILKKIKGKPKAAASSISTAKKKQPWQFGFHDLVINHLLVIYDDHFTNGHLAVEIPNANIEIKKLDLGNKLIEVNQAVISKALISYSKDQYILIDSSSHNIHFLGDMKLLYHKIDISSSHFVYNDNRKLADTSGMDFFHLDVKDINIQVSDGQIDHDTIFGKVNRLTCKEKCGFEVVNLTSIARVSTSDITLHQLDLQTGNSQIKDYLQFSYDSFPDFKKFISNVTIHASLNKSDLSLKDINYFAKGALNKIDHNHLWISGTIKGKLNNIKGKDIQLEAGLNTVFKGDFSMHGLPTFKETFISASIDNVVTNLIDIKRIYPGLLLPSFLQNLGQISYKGTFDGFPLDFVADGVFNTALGRVEADLNFKLPEKAVPIYSGHLATYQFNVGKLFNQEKTIGTLSMDAEIKGSGVTLADLNTAFEGKVNQIEVKGYNYQDINIDGSFNKKLFTGNLKIKDDNLDFAFKGTVNLDSTLPQFNFNADIIKADLQALHLFDKKVIISASSSIHFTGKKLDDFNGGINLKDMVIQTDSGIFPISHLSVNSYTDLIGTKILKLESSIVNANIKGAFNYSQLPNIAKAYINHYSIQPKILSMDTVGFAKVDFSIAIFEPGILTHLINKKFDLIKNSTVNGNFDSRSHLLVLNAQIPELIYANLKFKNFQVTARSDETSFVIDADLQNMYNKDSLLISNTFFKANWRADKYFDFSAFTSSLDSSYRADLHGIIGTDYKKILMSLENSNVFINNQKWQFAEGNKIQYSKKYLGTQNLILRQNEKEVYITATHPEDSITNLELDLSNISVKDFSKIFDKSKNNYFGKADGGLEIHDLFNKATYFSNLYIENLGVNKDTMGNLTLAMEVEDFKSKIPVTVKLKGKDNDIEGKGTYTPGQLENTIDINININKLKINVINNYLSRYVTESSGFALGQIKISGTDKKPQLTGFLNLKKCETTVAYINTHYKLENEIIKFKENEIRFDNVIIRDENNSMALAGGSIKHTNLKNFFFDINVTTDYFQMLKTTQKENPIYWGTINLTKATALFQGPLKNISIKVSGTTAKGSTISIPVRTTAETDNYSFYRFVNKADTVTKQAANITKARSLLDVAIDLDVTEDAEMTLILDPASGDRIAARGEGNIRVGYNDFGGLKVQGEYTITSGNYFFTLQNIINKYFTIDKGSRITFDGNIYDAMLDVSAVYSVRTATNDLILDRIANDEELKTASNLRVPTKLILLLNGPMQQPRINFNIKLENVDPRLQSYVDTKISELKNDKNELNKQAAALLVMNSFYPSGLGTGALLSGGATSTFSELLSTQISNLVSRFIGNFLKGFDFRLEYKPYTAEGSSGNDIYIGLRQGLLGQRLVFNAGGNINVSSKNSAKNQNQYNIDFSAEYQVTKDGRIKLKAYNKTSVGTSTADIYTNTGNRNSTGIGIGYKEEFDDFKDLREQMKARRDARKEKRQNKEPGHTPPAAILPNKDEQMSKDPI